MAGEEIKAMVRRELNSAGNLDVADEIVAAEFVGHDSAMPDPIRGPAGVKEAVTGYRTAFPRPPHDDRGTGGRGRPRRNSVEGDRDAPGRAVRARAGRRQATVTGTEHDPSLGGKIAEDWTNWDTLGLCRRWGQYRRRRRCRRATTVWRRAAAAALRACRGLSRRSSVPIDGGTEHHPMRDRAANTTHMPCPECGASVARSEGGYSPV